MRRKQRRMLLIIVMMVEICYVAYEESRTLKRYNMVLSYH